MPLDPALLQSPTILPQGAAWTAVLAAYLLGSVPFGLLVARARGVDLRSVGSGNIGATNAMRALGKPWGYFVFLLDVAKGAVPVLLFALPFHLTPVDALVLQVWCGAAAVLGHCFPLYLGFRGGKGVSTGLGALTALDPWIFVIGGTVWLVVLFATRFVGLASICMGLAFPVAAWFTGAHRVVVAGCGLLALLILMRHRSNIARMLAGTEPRSGAGKAGAKGDDGQG